MSAALARVDQIDTFTGLREACRHLESVSAALRKEVELRYGTLTDQPRLARKLEADLAPVIEAELFLERAQAMTGLKPLRLDATAQRAGEAAQ